jgi:hypothetical protein
VDGCRIVVYEVVDEDPLRAMSAVSTAVAGAVAGALLCPLELVQTRHVPLSLALGALYEPRGRALAAFVGRILELRPTQTRRFRLACRLVVQRQLAGKCKYGSTLDAAQAIYREEGLAGFWAGWDAAAIGGALNALLTSVCVAAAQAGAGLIPTTPI